MDLYICLFDAPAHVVPVTSVIGCKMSFNYDVFGAVTGGIGLLLAVIPTSLYFAVLRPKHLRKALDSVLSWSDQALVRIQETGILLDDYPGGLEAAQKQHDA